MVSSSPNKEIIQKMSKLAQKTKSILKNDIQARQLASSTLKVIASAPQSERNSLNSIKTQMQNLKKGSTS